jgi:CubicO group peptidase (beta-lactamase class C family)
LVLPLFATLCTLTIGTLTIGSGLPCAVPSDVAIASERLAPLDYVMQRGLAAGGYPGAAVVVARRGGVVWERGYGRVSWAPDAAPVHTDTTLYDLASLTKVVATTAAAMVLYDRGKLQLDTPVRTYLPEFTGGGRERVTVRDLLAHRSGLPVGRDLWRVARSPAEARRQVLSTPLESAPNTRYAYSDLGPDVLAFVVEAVSGQPLDRYVRLHVYEPLGMSHTAFRPAPALRARAAPTENSPPRGYPLRGEVHDENAYALGGVAGHAGLFSTAADLSIFAQTILNGGVYDGVRVFSDTAVRLFTRASGGWRALGWETCPGSGSCGQYLSRRTFGHTGFTGTSLWIDPERQMFVIVLSNWVHGRPGHQPSRWVLSDVRADVADIAALSIIDGPRRPARPGPLRVDMFSELRAATGAR